MCNKITLASKLLEFSPYIGEHISLQINCFIQKSKRTIFNKYKSSKENKSFNNLDKKMSMTYFTNYVVTSEK